MTSGTDDRGSGSGPAGLPPEAGGSAPLPDPEQVAAFLRANPGFLPGRPDLLDVILPPERDLGPEVIDLQQAIIRRQRAEAARRSRDYQAVVEVSLANRIGVERVHRCALLALDATSPEALAGAVAGCFPELLGVEAAVLCVEDAGETGITGVAEIAGITGNARSAGSAGGNAGDSSGPAAAGEGFLDAFRGAERIPEGLCILEKGAVEALFPGPVLQPRFRAGLAGGDPALFGPAAEGMRSDALIPIRRSLGPPWALLALGAGDPEMFSPQDAGELLEFLAATLARAMTRTVA